jgi:hypothetical protein
MFYIMFVDFFIETFIIFFIIMGHVVTNYDINSNIKKMNLSCILRILELLTSLQLHDYFYYPGQKIML